YSLAGAAADSFAHPAVVFAGVVALTALAWGCNIGHLRVQRRAVRRGRTSPLTNAQSNDDSHVARNRAAVSHLTLADEPAVARRRRT
ncbi:MAG TPA: hypothetical protein VG474_14000, partial [Solirubrobacteraceae bacterium]|nr:hypothetical protein [Solirubrobacteraceae bacterium]